MKKRIRKMIGRRRRPKSLLLKVLSAEGIPLHVIARVAKLRPAFILELNSNKTSPELQLRIVQAINEISGKEYEINDIFLHIEPDTPWPRIEIEDAE